eukprot:403371540
MSYDPWDTVSITIGWIYFAAWSISFYPQIFINYKRKSVDGFSIEFAMLNPQGFFFYSFYSIAGFVNPTKVTGTVAPNDLFFAVHAFAISACQFSQIFVYERGAMQKKLSWWPVALVSVEWIFVLILFSIEVSGTQLNDQISTLRVAGYCKALITFVKYMPQVYLNWKRKSTVGWSIENIVLDLTGGTFSLLQQIIDSTARGQPFFGTDSFNIVKFMLSIMSIFFDCIFLFQHYVLYKDAWKKKKNQDKLNQENDRMINKSDNIRENNTFDDYP